ncbi:MAG: DUF2029 domain-containing protein [Pirellulaceae bacterium]|nr:DUF2029 domain-containing protein [Pirellulaceae bacterium]
MRRWLACEKHKLLMASLPMGMLALWLIALASGNGQLDAMGNPIGGDFAMFYLAGQTGHSAQWSDLYDEPVQQQRLLALFPGLASDTYLPYRYPPLLAIVLAPLGSLPYLIAFTIFVAASFGVWLASWQALLATFWKTSDRFSGIFLYGLVASPLMAQTIMDGQASLWWFAIAAGCWVAIAQERFILAGVILSLSALKPNVLLLLSIVWVVRYPRLLLGILPSGVVMLVVTLSVAGRECLMTYIELARQLATDSWPVETPYWKVQSLISWSELVFGSNARRVNLWMGLSLAVGIGLWWRVQAARVTSVERSTVDLCGLCTGLIVNALFNPYTPIYDLTLLTLGLFACVAYVVERDLLPQWLARRDVQFSMLSVWLGPILSQTLSRSLQSPLQLMPAVLLTLTVYWLYVLQSSRPEQASAPFRHAAR